MQAALTHWRNRIWPRSAFTVCASRLNFSSKATRHNVFWCSSMKNLTIFGSVIVFSFSLLFTAYLCRHYTVGAGPPAPSRLVYGLIPPSILLRERALDHVAKTQNPR
jgi:hypothetical protein